MSHGRLIVLEGPDDVGKSSLAEALYATLCAEGIASRPMAFPGREPGSLGAHVYKLHHAPEAFGIHELYPTSLQLLHVAAHIDAIEHRIRPTLAAGEWVILDRFWWSTWVYGAASGIRPDVLQAILQPEFLFWRECQPDVVFLIERDASQVRPGDLQMFNRLARSYREFAAEQEKEHLVVTISNNASISESTKRMREVIDTLLCHSEEYEQGS